MRLSHEQVEQFSRDGFLVLPGMFSGREVDRLTQPLERLFAEDVPANFREKASGEVRTAMGLHERDPAYAKVVRHPRLLEPAMQLLGSALYVQQVKVNAKPAFAGEQWQWHYDFATHHQEDGVPEPLALNLHVFLDDVTDFNGPLWFIRGSHRGGPVGAELDNVTTSYPLWCVDNAKVTRLVETGGIASATGPAGTMLIFGDALVHGSPPNMSPWDRRIFSLIVNPIVNRATRTQRPPHQHGRNFDALVPLGDDCLLS